MGVSVRTDVTPVMLSCAARTRARSITIPQLHAARLPVRVFLDHCTPTPDRPEIGNKWIGATALEWAIPLGKPILVLEDDIDLAPDFTTGLDAALASGEVTYLYLNETEERMRTIYGDTLAERLQSRIPTPVTATRALTSTGLFGTQCVLLPNHAAKLVLETIPRVRKAFDAATQYAINRFNLPARVVTPNVVQHRHDRTCREPEDYEKKSVSFDCPRVPP